MASNIGKVKLSVKVFNEVPINRRTRREFAKFFGQFSIDTGGAFQFKTQGIVINPHPINGASLPRRVPIRNNNYLIDSNGNMFDRSSLRVISEREATLRRRAGNPNARATNNADRRAEENKILEDRNHAWEIALPWYSQYKDKVFPDKINESRKNVFGGTAPLPIGQVWGSGLIPAGDGSRRTISTPIQLKTTESNDLTRYGKDVNSDLRGGAHWALRKHSPIPINQPFFLELYINSDLSGGLGEDEIDRIEKNFSSSDLKEFANMTFGDKKGIRLANSNYFVVRLPSADTAVDYFVVLKPSESPAFYMLNRGAKRKAVIDSSSFDGLTDIPIDIIGDKTVTEITKLSIYKDAQSEDFLKKAHNETGRGHLRLEFIPTLTGLAIYNNVLPNAPWYISRSDPVYADDPALDKDGKFIPSPDGETFEQTQIDVKSVQVNYAGNITVYGGNSAALVNFGYVRYEESGFIETPGIPFESRDGASDGEPEAVFTAKGPGSDSNKKFVGGPGLSGGIAALLNVNRASNTRYFLDSDSVNGSRLFPPRLFAPASKRGTLGTDITAVIGSPDVLDTPFDKQYYWLIILTAGDTITKDGYIIENGRTPTLWGVRFVLPEGDPASNPALVADISKDVMSVSENYSSSTYQSIEHTMDIVVQNNLVPGEYVPSFDYNKFIDRVHFVQMTAGYEGGVGTPFDETRPSFTGLMHAGTRTKTPPLETFSLKCSDPIILLEKQLMLNSPIYDGMFTKHVVEDIAVRAGFGRESSSGILKVILDTNSQLSLPLSPSITKPLFRIEDRTNLKDAILRIAQRDWAVMYCDGEGNLRYADLAGGVRGDEDSALKAVQKEFFVNIRDADGDETAVMNSSYTISRDAMDAVNRIVVKTISGDYESPGFLDMIIKDDTNWASIYNPDAPGYLGFKKVLLINEAALAGGAQANAYLEQLKRFYTPPIEINFSCYGVPFLKALDIIKVNGQIARIISISNEIDASSNLYKSTIGAEWLFVSAKNNT